MKLPKSIFRAGYVAIALHFIRATSRKLLGGTGKLRDGPVMVSAVHVSGVSPVPVLICVGKETAVACMDRLNRSGIPGYSFLLEYPYGVRVDREFLREKKVIPFLDTIGTLEARLYIYRVLGTIDSRELPV